MGFDGRGRWYRWDKKDTVNDYLALSAHAVATSVDPAASNQCALSWPGRDGKARASLRFVTVPGSGVILSYSYQGQPVPPYLIRWDVTSPHFGGARYWWLCPHCGRRCATLYGGRLFLCRVCHDLTYETAQSGDFKTTIDNRMLAIRRRLGAPWAAGWPLAPLPDKPRGMHWQTYERLAREYARLAELRDLAFMVDLFCATDMTAELGYSEAELRDMLKDGWASRRAPDYGRDPAGWAWRLLADESARRNAPRRPERLTLGELATRAGVPVAFAREAQREGLLRPDAGRTKRAKRYRPKLAAWLAKLHELRAAGLAWDDLRAWAARRFAPGHEHERRYPAGARA